MLVIPTFFHDLTGSKYHVIHYNRGNPFEYGDRGTVWSTFCIRLADFEINQSLTRFILLEYSFARTLRHLVSDLHNGGDYSRFESRILEPCFIHLTPNQIATRNFQTA